MTSTNQDRGVRELFGSDAAAYDARQYGASYRTYIADRQKLVESVFRELAVPTDAPLLDLACGPGHFLAQAVALGYAPVGMDASESMLRTSAARLGDKAWLASGDANALPFPSETFAAVNCSGLIEYLPEPLRMLKEVFRVLKPGGRALVSSTNRLSPALSLSPVIDAVRRSAVARRLIRALHLPFDEMSLRERNFRLIFHTPRQFVRMFEASGFVQPRLHYYHLQFIPHPADRLMPRLSTLVVAGTDRLLGVPGIRSLSEGLLIDAVRPI